MKKFFKILGIILLIIIAFLIIHTLRNIIIINDITNKIKLYESKNNYYIKSISTQGFVIENFNKDNRNLIEMVHTSETGIRKMTRYSTENVINTYIEAQTEAGIEKIASLNSNSLPSFQGITNWLYTENTSQLALTALLSHIRSVEQNGKDCYEITYIYSSNILMPAEGDFVLYIEKETGLTIRNKNGTMVDSNGNKVPIIVDYEYKFDVVTEEDLQEPDISQYRVQDNNSEKSDKTLSVDYVVLEVEDIEAEEKNQQGLEYKTKKITDKQKIDSLIKIIDDATLYKEKSFIADFGDVPPSATIYLTNGEEYTIAAGDQIDDDGDIVNLMTRWYSNDGSDKSLYKVDTKLGEYIEKLFND